MNHAHSFGRSQSDPILDHTIKIGKFFNPKRPLFVLLTVFSFYCTISANSTNEAIKIDYDEKASCDDEANVGFKFLEKYFAEAENEYKMIHEQILKNYGQEVVNATSDFPHAPSNENKLQSNTCIPKPELVYVIENNNEPNPQQVYNAILPAFTDDIDMLIETFKRKLPSKAIAKKRIQKAKNEHPELGHIIKQLKNPEHYARVKYPSRLLFIGPSGCGKTTTAEALAKYCDMTCIFIKASSIATTYQNSGAQFFELLFRCLKNNQDDDFLVIIDEISTIAQFSSDDKDLQQNKMATSFWLGLDEIRNERHICIIGTDNKDPENLPDQIKTRFKNNIFYFKPPKIEVIVSLIKEGLEQIPKHDETYLNKKGHPVSLHSCSDKFLYKLAQSLSHLSLREIEDLVEKAKAMAIRQADDPCAPVKEHHLQTIFFEYSQAWYTKAWKNRRTYCKQLTSPRALTLYAAVTGLIMRFYTENYKDHGMFVTAMACLINNYLPRAASEPNDLPLFNTITTLFADHEYREHIRKSQQNQF